ncbi:putative mixed-linked glucanase precursor [Phaeomoniella chlamydospora]|uniref:Putative mixed-linked glucanase n=1 Tax=Phaeomoniella chlamydospora TaxID=158046 RepID=A0A0G2GED9_PHACM|nr:putative mixed-linked glucanase precursor [Phaeomoniella chlamydospora]
MASVFSLLLFSSALLPTCGASYILKSDYNYLNWFNSFIVENIADPTGGYVEYVSQSEAQSSGLYKVSGNQVYIGVDNTTTLSSTGTGRKSVRLSSGATYDSGLFIADFAHLPGGQCGSWPAYWLVGDDWPNNGEIDIMEGINAQSKNQHTIHSADGCIVEVGKYGETGTAGSATNCGAGGGYNGCTVFSNKANSYGTGFNSVDGGVMAMKWNSSVIKVWQWPRASVPSDITLGLPNPNLWGVPVANWAGCEFSDYFSNMNIMFDTTFCGDWAGNQWKSSSTCSKLASTCNEYVAANPTAFSDTYWLINYVKVYDEL